MKERWSIGNKKVSSLEEGLVSTEELPCAKHVRTNKTWKQLIQCVKLILYLELVLFIGWLCYSMWQTYRAESMQAKVMDNIGKVESQNLFEHPTYDRTTNSHDYSYRVDNIFMKNLLLDDLVQTKQALKMKKNEPDNREPDVTTSTTENYLLNKKEKETNDEQVKNEEQRKNKWQEEKNEDQEEKNVEQVKNEEQEEKNEKQEGKYEKEEGKNEAQREWNVELDEEKEDQTEKNEEQEEKYEREEGKNEAQGEWNVELDEEKEDQTEKNEEQEEKYEREEGKNEAQGEWNVELDEEKEDQQEKNEEQEEKYEELDEKNEEQEEKYEEQEENKEQKEKNEKQIENGEQDEKKGEEEEKSEKQEEMKKEQEEKYETQEEMNKEREEQNEKQAKNSEEEETYEEQEERMNSEQEEKYEEQEERNNSGDEETLHSYSISNVGSEDTSSHRFVGLPEDTKWNENASDSWKSPEVIKWRPGESAETQDYDKSSESQETEYVREEKLENYLLFSLILENAMRNPETDEVVAKDNTTPSSEQHAEESTNENEKSRVAVDSDSMEEKSEETSTISKSSGDSESLIVASNPPKDEQKEVDSSVDTNESTKVEENTPEPDMQHPEEDYYNKQTEDERESSEISEFESFDSSPEFDLSDYDVDRDLGWYSGEFSRLWQLRELHVRPMITHFPRGCEDMYFRANIEALKPHYCCNRMRLRKRSNTESMDTNEDQKEVHTNNGEERSGDNIAPQLLKEKIQNDVISGLVHRIARDISKNPINEDTSVNANDMKFIPEWHSVNDKNEYSDSDELLKDEFDKLAQKMMVLAQHIDKLQNQLLCFNHLADDYVSKEMSS